MGEKFIQSKGFPIQYQPWLRMGKGTTCVCLSEIPWYKVRELGELVLISLYGESSVNAIKSSLNGIGTDYLPREF